jgi:hypothetical protein
MKKFYYEQRKKTKRIAQDLFKRWGLTALIVAIDFILPSLNPLASEWVTSANADSLDMFSILGKNGVRALNN